MRKRGLCCGPVYASVCLSVCLPVTFVHSIQTAEDIVKLICRLGSPIILVFRRDASICIARISYGNVCLGGWLGGWLSVTADIVSKRLNLS